MNKEKFGTLQDFEPQLSKAIEAHLPTSAQLGFRSDFGDKKPEPRSRCYAIQIFIGFLSGSGSFGLTEAKTPLSEVRQNLQRCIALLDELNHAHKAELSSTISPSCILTLQDGPSSIFAENLVMASMKSRGKAYERGEEMGHLTPNEVAYFMSGRTALTDDEAMLIPEMITGKGSVERLHELLAQASEALIAMEQKYETDSLASGKPNWKAAAIAGKCRLVWAMEHREINSALWQLHKQNSKFPHDHYSQEWYFAPKSQHHDAPGPFGRFLNDVLAALLPQNANGETVSASVALRQWKKTVNSQRSRDPKHKSRK